MLWDLSLIRSASNPMRLSSSRFLATNCLPRHDYGKSERNYEGPCYALRGRRCGAIGRQKTNRRPEGEEDRGWKDPGMTATVLRRLPARNYPSIFSVSRVTRFSNEECPRCVLESNSTRRVLGEYSRRKCSGYGESQGSKCRRKVNGT
jgi:hypothetical protein